ncbi:MAG TPA: hypothetical protein V6D07_19055 [Trichocoleus sp.]
MVDPAKDINNLLADSQNIVIGTGGPAGANGIVAVHSEDGTRTVYAIAPPGWQSGKCIAYLDESTKEWHAQPLNSGERLSNQTIVQERHVPNEEKCKCPSIGAGNAFTQSGLSKVFTTSVKGSFLLSGVGASARGGGNGTGTIYFSPVDFPHEAQVCKAFLYWNTIGKLANEFTSVTLDGNPVTGIKVGQTGDTCWSYESNKVYRADVRTIVGNTLSKNRLSFNVSGLPHNVANQAGDNQGAALLIIYCDCKGPKKPISVYDGAYAIGNSVGWAYQLDFGEEKTIKKIGFAVGDGQPFDDGPIEIGGVDIIPGDFGYQTVFSGARGSFMDTLIIEGEFIGNSVKMQSYNDCLCWFLCVTEG